MIETPFGRDIECAFVVRPVNDAGDILKYEVKRNERTGAFEILAYPTEARAKAANGTGRWIPSFDVVGLRVANR